MKSTLIACFIAATYFFSVPVKVRDDINNRKFVLSIENKTGEDFCLSTTNWPSAIGKLESASDRVWVDINSERFYYTNVQDVCPSCRLKVRRGAKVSSELKYEDFSIPESLFNNIKKLHYSVVALKCGY